MSSSIDRALRIGLVTWDFDPPKGGLGRAMQLLRRGLEECGFSVRMLTPQTSRLLRITQRLGGHMLFSLLLPFVLEKWMRGHGIACLLFPCGPGGTFLVRVPRGAHLTVVVYHTYAQQCRAVPGQWWKRIFIPLERHTLHVAEKILCYSEDTARSLARDYQIEENRIVLLPQLLEEAASVPVAEKDGALCVCIARLERRKGIDVLLRAWPRVEERVSEAQLVLIGDGILRRKIDRMIHRTRKSARRIPRLSDGDLHSLLERADVAVCPSFLEGFGLAAVEAMRSGAAVVAAKSDGLRSLVRDGETGMLVPPDDPTALADAIVHLLKNRELRDRMSASAKHDILTRFERGRAVVSLREALQASLASV